MSVLGAALSKNETGKPQTSAHPAELTERRFKKMTKDIVCVSSEADSDKIYIDYFDKRKRLLNMAAVLLFRRETNMSAVKSREQALYTRPLSSLTFSRPSRALLLWWNGTINDPVSHL